VQEEEEEEEEEEDLKRTSIRETAKLQAFQRQEMYMQYHTEIFKVLKVRDSGFTSYKI